MGSNRAAEKPEIVLVARKGRFGLPTACPVCLPVYCYLRFANVNVQLQFDRANPDSDHIPYAEYGDYVAFNNEKGGVIERLNGDNIVELDSQLSKDSFPDWVSTKVLISTWLAEAVQYELWVASDSTIAHEIYFSDLPWPLGKILYWKQAQAVRQLHGVTKVNAEEKEEEIYGKANIAYEALSVKLGSEEFFFERRPTSVDALFLGHAAFVLHALPETSVLRSSFVKHANLIKFAKDHTNYLVEPSSSSASGRSFPFDASSSSVPRREDSKRSSKSKPKQKRQKTEEEKSFQRRAKYFIAAQVVSILVFLSVLGGVSGVEDVDEDSLGYEE
ncbi:mitochondrial outer membrane import complex protein METAXIN [Canna indica]|uniref:Metaxin n=1 Tax=Canna indica TaxID=4628 RepID=A0AAQ3KE14_9LILI|nr:mitochondrial outer membrane import complex protein METAXIN [Canna indica]